MHLNEARELLEAQSKFVGTVTKIIGYSSTGEKYFRANEWRERGKGRSPGAKVNYAVTMEVRRGEKVWFMVPDVVITGGYSYGFVNYKLPAGKKRLWWDGEGRKVIIGGTSSGAGFASTPDFRPSIQNGNKITVRGSVKEKKPGIVFLNWAPELLKVEGGDEKTNMDIFIRQRLSWEGRKLNRKWGGQAGKEHVKTLMKRGAEGDRSYWRPSGEGPEVFPDVLPSRAQKMLRSMSPEKYLDRKLAMLVAQQYMHEVDPEGIIPWDDEEVERRGQDILKNYDVRGAWGGYQ